jgi:hypothetical protein
MPIQWLPPAKAKPSGHIKIWRYVAKRLEDDGRVVFFGIRIAAPREGCAFQAIVITNSRPS